MEKRALISVEALAETSNTGEDLVYNEIDLESLGRKVQEHRAKAVQERSEAQKLRQEAAELRGNIKLWKEQHRVVLPSSYQKEDWYPHHQQVQAQQLQTKLDLTMIANIAAQERVRSGEQRIERAEQIAQRKELLAECNELMVLQGEQMIEAIRETSAIKQTICADQGWTSETEGYTSAMQPEGYTSAMQPEGIAWADLDKDNITFVVL